MERSFSSTSALGPQLLSSTPGHRPLCPETSSLQAGTSSGNLMHKPSPKGAWFMAPGFQQEAWGQGRESWTGRPGSESRGFGQTVQVGPPTRSVTHRPLFHHESPRP